MEWVGCNLVPHSEFLNEVCDKEGIKTTPLPETHNMDKSRAVLVREGHLRGKNIVNEMWGCTTWVNLGPHWL